MRVSIYEVADDNYALLHYIISKMLRRGRISNHGYSKVKEMLEYVKEVTRNMERNDVAMFNLGKLFGVIETAIHVYLVFGEESGDVFIDRVMRIITDPEQFIEIGSWRGS